MSALTLNKSTVSTMSATASLGSWIAAVKVAGVGIGQRPPVPVLAGVRIAVNGGIVTAQGFDYETSATAHVVGADGTDGTVLVMHKLLLDMLTTAGKRAVKRVSDSWQVKLTVEGSMLKVEVNGTTYSLATLPESEYPQIPSGATTRTVSVSTALFIQRMDSAMVAVSTDDTLPILTGIKIEVANGTMSLLATDRYRLVMAELPVVGAGEYSTLIRSKTWKSLKRVLAAKGEDLTIGFHEAADAYAAERVTFRQGSLEVSTLKIDGDYPKIRALFPEVSPVVFEVNADLLASAVASVAVTAERNTPVRLTYNGIDSLRIDAGTGEDAQGQAFMPYSAIRGNRGFAVAYNPKYLLATLKDMKGQLIEFRHDETGKKPALIVSTDSDAVQHLVMPVRLPN